MLDGDALRLVGGHTVEPGERLPVAASSASVNRIDESKVVVRDTTVASMDAEGVLHAMSVGRSWIVWPRADVFDSAAVTVSLPIDLQQPFVAPTLPAKTVDVRAPRGRSLNTSSATTTPTGKSIKVGIGGDLQAAINSAVIGDEIVLANGATFKGNFVLPAKAGADAGWIVIRAETYVTAAGTRMTPTLAEPVAKVFTPNQDPAVRTLKGARKWRLVGFEIGHQQGAVYNYGIVVLGRGDETALDQQPSEITLERMYIHGSPTDGTSRCIAFNGRSLAVVDSWISECHAKGFDAQGVGGWNGGGPFLIENNRIEASGQGVLFGGADPVIVDLSPSDITIRRNYFYKPMSWIKGRWTVKAVFELKHGKRVLFENNVLENHWIDAQVGFAILLQTLADNNTSWNWTTVQDVTVRNNVIRNSTSGANVLARVAYNGGTIPTNPTARVAFINNLWLEVGHDPVTGEEGRLLQLLGDLSDATMANNTFTLSAGRAAHIVSLAGPPETRTTIVNNVFPSSSYGMFGSSKGSGTVALTAYAPGSVVTGNVIPGQIASAYPAANYFPSLGVLALPLTQPLYDGCAAAAAWRLVINVPTTVGVDCTLLDQALNTVMGTP